MSRRNSRQVTERTAEAPRLLSEFVDDPDPKLQHFVLRWVPRPPDVKHEIVPDPVRREMREQVSLSVGCPHCHEDVAFRYDTAAAATPLIRRLWEVLESVRSLEFALAMELTGRPEMLRNLVAVCEELSQKFRGW